ncbi:ATP-binding cassette domain-containing protein, partial [Listeria monocytogenes]|nr:ATP-binding cassette domain-containing protein [Listeria monocytogenes]
STNTVGGRCEECQGNGFLSVPMHFLPDVQVKCPTCQGKRFKQEILQIKYNDFNIFDILSMDITQAKLAFATNKKIFDKLVILEEIGLGYLILGQTTSTLSGGEAQRVKLAKELINQSESKRLYLFDEPTTGLHQHDVQKVVSILKKLVDKGNSVFVIEHNLNVIAQSDFIIDMGLGGGKSGGSIIVQGTPKEISESDESVTGNILKKLVYGEG